MAKKKKQIKANKVIKNVEPTPLPKRKVLQYDANMDNIIIEAIFAKGSNKDDKGNYVAPHLREVTSYIVISKGPLVNNPKIKKGAKIVPENIGKITVFEIDEKGYIGTIKPHHVLAIIK